MFGHMQIPIHKSKSLGVSCIESGGCGFICHTFKPLKKANGVFTTLYSSKKLVKQFVQVASECCGTSCWFLELLVGFLNFLWVSGTTCGVLELLVGFWNILWISGTSS